MDSPELSRLVVLQSAIIARIVAIDVEFNEDEQELLLEHDALLVVIARRCQSAIGYHLTARGKDALETAGLIANTPHDEDGFVELKRLRFSQEQAQSPFRQLHGPEEEVYIDYNANGLELLAGVHQGADQAPPIIEPEPV